MKNLRSVSKMVSFLLLIVFVLTLAGCGDDESVPESEYVPNLSFSDYYKNAHGFEKFEPELQAYFKLLQKAYNESDKHDIRTFQYDKDRYDSLSSSLKSIFDSYKIDDMTELEEVGRDRYLATLNAASIYYGMNSQIASVNLQINSNMLPKENPEWFRHFEQELQDMRDAFLKDE